MTLADGIVLTPSYDEGGYLAQLQGQIRGGAAIDLLKD